MFSALRSVLDRNIGRCPRCMKIAFVCAVAAWVICSVIMLALPPRGYLATAIAIPAALTSLWLAHAMTYGTRVFKALQAEYLNPAPACLNDLTPSPMAAHGMTTRRNALWVISTAATITAVATLWLPARAFAAGHPCGEGRNCPDDAPNCCSRSAGKCCDGNWACVPLGKCYSTHEAARNACGTGTIWACS